MPYFINVQIIFQNRFGVSINFFVNIFSLIILYFFLLISLSRLSQVKFPATMNFFLKSHLFILTSIFLRFFKDQIHQALVPPRSFTCSFALHEIVKKLGQVFYLVGIKDFLLQGRKELTLIGSILVLKLSDSQNENYFYFSDRIFQ